jgi:deoxyribodipyrimidine photolyase-related protein
MLALKPGKILRSSRMSSSTNIDQLIVILGDQLSLDSPALKQMDPKHDQVWMAEVSDEATHVPCSKIRLTLFLSAMRHFADELTRRKIPLSYHRAEESSAATNLKAVLCSDLRHLKPAKVICVEPGEWRVKEALHQACDEAGIPLQWLEDDHFLTSHSFFQDWAKGRREWRLEYFYRAVRKSRGILLDAGEKPTGGKWNYDAANRGSFGSKGPQTVPQAACFPPDAITQEVMGWVATNFADHPGSIDSFNWPVTREQALLALNEFINSRLALFGTYQDAMWTHQPILYHSCISAAMNLKLLKPAEVIDAVLEAYQAGQVGIEATEGFIRQIAGWREFVRHVYWQSMPGYLESNHFDAGEPLPQFYWNADTPLSCLHHCVSETLTNGYAHHIQRLMVLGLYSLMLGVKPKEIHAWFLGVYADAVEWVEAPNVIGMSQFADGGRMSSKPYIATGKYIKRMSNYCQSCPRDPDQATGPKACPFTTLYWDFLIRHEDSLRGNQRLAFQLKNLGRLNAERRQAVTAEAARIRQDPSCQGNHPDQGSLF